MRNLSFILIFVCLSWVSYGQQLFPIKIKNQWGLINADGKVVLEAKYNAIGEFKQFGYAVMQRNGGVGMLRKDGQEIVPPIYQDLKILDSTLVSVMDKGLWKVINLDGKVVLQPGYEKVKVLKKRYLAFTRNGKWGIVDSEGQLISEPVYDKVSIFKDYYFRTEVESLLGLMTLSGKVILQNIAEEVVVYNPDLFFYRKLNTWGAVDASGQKILQEQISHFSKIDKGFVKLTIDKRIYLFSTYLNQTITQEPFNAFYPFSKDYVICKKDRQLGLIDQCGNLILKTQYQEIQAYSEGLFRVNLNGKWGVVNGNDDIVIEMNFDYIAPMKNDYCVVIKDKKLGVSNFNGKIIVPTKFDRIELEEERAKAYIGEALEVFNFNKSGELSHVSQFKNFFKLRIGGGESITNVPRFNTENQYVLDKFEWFYSPFHDKWGLRRLDNGAIQIEPTFDEIRVQKDLGLTLVGIEQFENYDFDRTSYRFEMAYGLVNNHVGLLVKEVDLIDLRVSDFRNGNPTARCVFTNGRHGLINRIGKVILRNYAFIGDFHEGAARMSIKGKLSGSLSENTRTLGKVNEYISSVMAPSLRIDYTLHDREFERKANLTCNGCSWGYLDTLGNTIVHNQYTFAEPIVNNVGIVECHGKWGMVNKNAKELIPCNYDGINFVEDTGNQMVQIFKKDEKYGLIDTLGNMTVDLKYDEIGSYKEGRLAVKRNGFWGFVDKNGLEIIPCRFNRVQNFSDTLAAVKLGSKWGYINKLGEVIIDFRYAQAGNFMEGIAYAKKQSEPFGYIDKKGEWIIPARFDKAFDFDHFGTARVEVFIGEYFRTGVINRKGNFIIRPKFISIGSFNQYGLAVVGYGGTPTKYGLINLRGEMITQQAFREIGTFHEGLAEAKTRKGYGYLNTMGELVISNQFTKVGPFSEGKAFARKEGYYGFINRRGDFIIEPQFSRCMNFKDGKAVVYKGNRKAGLIDSLGNFLIEPSINKMIQFSEGRGLVQGDNAWFYFITEVGQHYNGFYQNASFFEHGIAVVKQNEKWGIINQKGIALIPPKYDKIEKFENGYARVRIKGFNGLSNLQGELIIRPDYEYLSYAGEGVFRVEQGDKIGYFDVDGKWIWDLSD